MKEKKERKKKRRCGDFYLNKSLNLKLDTLKKTEEGSEASFRVLFSL